MKRLPRKANLSQKKATKRICDGYAWDNGVICFFKDEPDPECPHCKGSGGVQTGENEYSTCPCVNPKKYEA